MDNFIVNLNKISKKDAISISTSLLYTLKNSPQYSTVSELSYILDYDSFMRLIKYYGGETIRIPSIEEINDTLKLLLVYQYYEVENFTWHESLEKAGYTLDESVSTRAKLGSLRKILKDQKIGGRSYG